MTTLRVATDPTQNSGPMGFTATNSEVSIRQDKHVHTPSNVLKYTF